MRVPIALLSPTKREALAGRNRLARFAASWSTIPTTQERPFPKFGEPNAAFFVPADVMPSLPGYVCAIILIIGKGGGKNLSALGRKNDR